MKNLVIGNTSQLSHYFPDDYIQISSRNIDFDYLYRDWDSVYITFAEQRIYDCDVDYISVNYTYTLKIIEFLLNAVRTNKIVYYTSCELWNDLSGYIKPTTLPKFKPINNEYIVSKMLLLNKIIERRKHNPAYEKVVLIHPFYFNSVHRSNYFLFGKIFDSIINKKQINVGNLNFYRDMVHTKFVVDKSIQASSDMTVGAGRLFNIRDFVQDLYKLSGMDYNQFVREDLSATSSKEKLIMANVDWDYTYQQLLADTHGEILEWTQ